MLAPRAAHRWLGSAPKMQLTELLSNGMQVGRFDAVSSRIPLGQKVIEPFAQPPSELKQFACQSRIKLLRD